MTPGASRMVACALGALLLWAAPAWADDAWEQEVQKAIDAQDKEIRDAARQGTTSRVVAKYKSKLSRQDSSLNVYLVGRALFYDRRPDESMRYLKRTLAESPGFWYAERGMALLYLQQQDLANAKVHLDRVRARRPDDLDLLSLAARLHLVRKEWPQARALVDQYLEKRPDDAEMRVLLVEIHSQTKNLEGATRELATLVRQHPESPQLRMSFGDALARSERFKEAAEQFERVWRMDAQAIHVLSLLEFCYIRAKNWKGLTRTFERIRDNVKDPKEKARAEQALEVLAKGPPPEAQPDEWKEDPVSALVRQCIDPEDPDARHKALLTYFDSQIGYLPLILYSRMNPDHEPDPRCRLMLARILGQLGVLEAAPRIASGLWDPDMRVRRVVVDELSQFRTKAMLIYLEPYFTGLPIDDVPDDDEFRANLESEYNAAREALRDLTAFRDVEIGTDWVSVEQMQENRKRWVAYFKGELGRAAMLDAVRAFERVRDPYLENHLARRVMAEHDLEIVRAAYDQILAKADSALTGDDPDLKKRWLGFPRLDSKTFTKDNLPLLRARMKTFFRERRERLMASDGR